MLSTKRQRMDNGSSMVTILPFSTVKCDILPFLNEIDLVCFMRTCKTAYKMVGKIPDVNGLYQRMKFCSICKQKHDVSYRDRSSKMYAHVKCINRRFAYWTFFNGGASGGLVYKNKKEKYNTSTGLQPTVQIFGTEYVDIINRDNTMTVSSLYRRLAPRNHTVLDYEKCEDVLLGQHVWFSNNKHMIIDADKYFKCREWQKLRISKGKRVDVYKIYKHRLLTKVSRVAPSYPSSLQELVNAVHILYIDCQTFVDQMTNWHSNLKRAHGYNWFHEAHMLLGYGTVEETRLHVFDYVYSTGELIVELINKELCCEY